MNRTYDRFCQFNNQLVILGWGSISQAVLPLILRHIEISPKQITIISDKETRQGLINEYGVNFLKCLILRDNYYSVLNETLGENDFLLNLAVDVCSKDLIQLCQQKNALYLDTSNEVWKEDDSMSPVVSAARTNYVIRENLLASNSCDTTAILTHGANPGLVSHMVKQALCNLAEDNQINFKASGQPSDWGKLANALSIKAIHVAEYDSQQTSQLKSRDEFVNTWSIDGFITEGLLPAELGWGTHERHWPVDAMRHESGPQCAIYLNRPAASVKVRTWAPNAGPFHGFLITHAESISLANYLSVEKEGETIYRPTVHYAYSPCPDALLSMNELAGRNWVRQTEQRLIIDNIIHGMDELGVLLLGNAKGAYWYGSQLTIEEACRLAPYNNATTLQVASGVLAGIIWAINNPKRGLVEPEMMDYEMVLAIARPYLGTLGGYYSDWTPLKNRAVFHWESIDPGDPWQFKNIRVE